MEIQYLGHSAFKIKINNTLLITDPFLSDDPDLGIKFPKIEARIVTVSHNHHDHNGVAAVSGNPFIIRTPGEYEVSGINIFGYATFHDEKEGKERGRNTIYLIEGEKMNVCHLGDLGHVLENELVEMLGEVDVLLIPVGGTYTLDAVKATEVVRQIEPKIVIPMHYFHPKFKFKLNPVENFVKEMGVGVPEKTDKLKLSKDKLPQETKLVIMEAS
ncbi:lactamase [candidate division WWE3 bacterium CG06_land_8_20_14_3_00_42_16]|uniref:Lactamase n=4 Tax=Katanobacteria TaxID=422282 RepID=A0A2M7ALW0_UNCKA|nr:MAG: hypothetical protein AUJ38_01450 [bacterium CG1_02_42_9]PIU68386.1 MAG: lactamase [candidate division WWE3 bacterium CG06_land_8_20_14_3_00_42_16]PIZ42915.1 MAG: lactamase [candidate division WWE3 bacterium CG_4_10_14_0_2_um_filter_42_8]PJA38594.1 MAG: lactamase [candidate division WWE3 bacterium CG_4_9_14_3_um_filter_43_9]PJC68361.1 MAG: lactamase [candidate division WWE3 bacterium CG_4_8_14_3_um_filter_42_11]